MPKEKWPRQQVRIVKSTPLRKKSFGRDGMRVAFPKRIHALEVIRDLREGSLDSLDQYLRQNKGIPDREVALELRKLISGSAARSNHRLIVAKHPQLSKNRGGAPRGHRPLTKQERKIADEVRKLRGPGKCEAAVLEVAHAERIDESTIRAITKRVDEVEQAEGAAKRLQRRSKKSSEASRLKFEKALQNLRK